MTSSCSLFCGSSMTAATAGSPPAADWGGFMASTTSHVRPSQTRTVPSLDPLITCSMVQTASASRMPVKGEAWASRC